MCVVERSRIAFSMKIFLETAPVEAANRAMCDDNSSSTRSEWEDRLLLAETRYSVWQNATGENG